MMQASAYILIIYTKANPGTCSLCKVTVFSGPGPNLGCLACGIVKSPGWSTVDRDGFLQRDLATPPTTVATARAPNIWI